ncbi:phytanoyl-CoA dioxygenase family protein [Parasphingorhabdus sp.]|uniref:phytanoyl-CoA dioxygenase family protein n=1 Tax=Parasphingorhabdus sp. TaxID=2709688 RepID=UPI0032652864
MALNKRPLREVTQQDIDDYARDGAVCLRSVLDRDWIDLLEPIAREVIIDKKDVGLLPTIPGRYMARCIEEYRKFVFESPIAEVAGQVMQSKEIRFFFDEFFAKPPQSDAKTLWHCDRMGWPVTGTMVPSIWIPLTPIVKANCLEVLAGTQHDDVPYWLFSPNARQMIKPDDRVPHPEIESKRGDPDLRFLTWDMEPGDLLIVHPWVLHYSSGNPTDDWRVAISERVFGDDIRWAPRPDCVNLAGVSFDEMLEGEKPKGSHFPLLWSEDGRADGDAHFPAGFATRWPKREMQGVNEYKAFRELKVKEDAGELSGKDTAPAN